MGKRWLVPVGLAAAALIATGCGSSANAGAASANQLTTTKIGSATVLTDSKGFTLYWFVPDTSTTSKCNGQCAKFWPPLKGPVTAGSGVTGTLGTIKRSDGSTQATWNGHPLYTFLEDKKPGQAKGNGLNLSGGVWHEVTLSGSSGSGGGGGYTY
jgi:predicted lipoprotein with Yx(FWY)xxD motif